MEKPLSSSSRVKKPHALLNQQQPPQDQVQNPPKPDPNATSSSYAVQQDRERAITILDNDQLLMRYAIANNISVPQIRVYFEKVAAGFDPEPVIKEWFPFTKSG